MIHRGRCYLLFDIAHLIYLYEDHADKYVNSFYEMNKCSPALKGYMRIESGSTKQKWRCLDIDWKQWPNEVIKKSSDFQSFHVLSLECNCILSKTSRTAQRQKMTFSLTEFYFGTQDKSLLVGTSGAICLNKTFE